MLDPGTADGPAKVCTIGVDDAEVEGVENVWVELPIAVLTDSLEQDAASVR
ncbi:MAG TPA: hypothetical protein VG455_13030 [Acidimicrobiales bacterium]|nr:hypothetical protein [Acidimicrobiales bacterium]